MKILWFSHINLMPNQDSNYTYPGGNWILSLKELLECDKNIELGIAFFGENDLFFKNENGTSFFQISSDKKNKFVRLIERWKHKIDTQEQTNSLVLLLNEFNPDLIHIFGTESVFGKIINHTKIPAVIHIQGLINPCLNAWFFQGSSIYSVLKNSNSSYFLRGVGLYHDLINFRNKAKRELDIFKTCNNYIGRTNWDKAVSNLFAPNSNYYHCDEVLRDSFYNQKWKNPRNDIFIICTTINTDIYKGLDLILKTAILLTKHSKLNFVWYVFGVSVKSEYAKIVEDVVKDNFELRNVLLKGIIDEKGLLENLLDSNLYVHTSNIDNSPNSVCEAQLIGLPIISTNVGGISSLINDGIDGFLLPPNEPHILASKIVELANNPIKLKEISENEIKVAELRHNRSKIKNDLINIYSEILHDYNSELKIILSST